MKTELMLENMSHSIAYWYTEFSNSHKCETIFPTSQKQKEAAYKLLRVQYGDADVIISPTNKVYEIDKDVNVEQEKQSYMFFVKDVSANNKKLEKINNIQPYRLTDRNWVRMVKCTHKMFDNGIPYAAIFFKVIDFAGNTEISEITRIMKNNIRNLSYLNLSNEEIVRCADIVEEVDDKQIMLILSNISKENAKCKLEYLIDIINANYPNLKFKKKLSHSDEYTSFECFQKQFKEDAFKL